METSSSTLDDGAQALPVTESRPEAPVQDNLRDEMWTVFMKDVRSELRTRAALTTILMFAVGTLIITSFCIDTRGFGFTQGLATDEPSLLAQNADALIRTIPEGTEKRHKLLAALFWIVLFFSAIVGLPRTFVKEEEMRTAAALRLAARPGAVFGGKLLFNVVLNLLVLAVVLPLFLFLFTPYVGRWDLFLAMLVVGTVGLAGTATILGAMVARAGGKSYLMLPLALPILLPILVFTINGTAEATRGNVGNQLLGLLSYVVAMVAVSAMLFERVWGDD